MKRADIRKANDILDLYMACVEKMRAQEDIAVSGPTQETKMMEFHGDFPQLSNIKPDIISSKVDKIRRIYITTEERIAYRCVMDIPYSKRCSDRLLVLAHRYNMNRHNPETQKPFTHADCAKALGLQLEEYEADRNELLDELIKRFDKAIARYTTKNNVRAQNVETC